MEQKNYENNRNMKLELKHIAPYLPYSLKWNDSRGNLYNTAWLSTKKLSLIDVNGFGELETITYDSANRNGVKPRLRSFSQLTEEIEHTGERFVPIEKIGQDFFQDGFFEDEEFVWANEFFDKTEVLKIEHNESGELVFNTYMDGEVHVELTIPYKYTEWLYEWHFDWRHNLIEKGLAIAKTN